MLQSLNDLLQFAIHAADGEIGTIEDAYFDDAHWRIRYLVVLAGSWLSGRRVLISPAAVQQVDWQKRRISVALTCEQVRNSPGIDTEKPVSRQHEEDLNAYYGWPFYWNFDPFGVEPLPVAMPLPQPVEGPQVDASHCDPHLRSAHEVKGYQIEAQDGSVGHVSDFVFEDQSWEIRFLVVDAGSWLRSRLVLLQPRWIDRISWEERHVTVRLTREAIRTSPKFLPVFPLSAEYAEQLLQHYDSGQ